MEYIHKIDGLKPMAFFWIVAAAMFTITVVAIQNMNTEYVEFRCATAQCIVYKYICIVYCLSTTTLLLDSTVHTVF